MRRLPTAVYPAAALLLWLPTGCNVGGAPARVEAPADSAAGEVAFELAGPNDAALLVPVYLNGQGPFDFVLDTGATLTCVDRSVARQLELPEQRGVLGVGAGVGGAGRIRLVSVDSLRIGASRAFDVTVCELDLAQVEQIGLQVDGLLGLNFLKAFRLTLDFEREVLILTEP